MELITCHVENFGTLSGVTLNLGKGLNAFCLKNGQGKTTLFAFLKCMLYGLPENRRQSLSENERKHYAPWQGGVFGGSLTLRHEGRLYRISRVFGSKPSEDRLEVFDENTGAVTHALGDCPGETIFGLDRQGFSGCALFSERDFALSFENESVLSQLGGEIGEQDGSISSALALLEEERRMYEKKGGRGLLAETEAEISRLTQQYVESAQIAATLVEREQRLLSAKAALSKLSLQDEADAEDAPFSIDLPSKKKKRRPRFAIFSILLALLSLIAGNLVHPILFSGVALAFFLFFLGFSGKGGDKEKGGNEKQTKISPIRSEAFEERYRACALCERAYVEAVEAAEENAYLKTQIEALEKKKSRLSCTLSDIKKTEELLTEVGRHHRAGCAEQAQTHFSRLLKTLGEMRGKSFKLGDRFSPSFLAREHYRSAEVLSRGEKDRVSLARSLALLSSMPSHKKPPLLLDDPFLCYDDEHLEIALSALEELAKEYQIVYLTCSHSRMP